MKWREMQCVSVKCDLEWVEINGRCEVVCGMGVGMRYVASAL